MVNGGIIERETVSLLKESRLVFVFHVGSKLDLSLDSCKLTGLIKGDRVGSIYYIIPSLGGRQGDRKQGRH